MPDPNERLTDLEMMQSPGRWPHGYILPLKKRDIETVNGWPEMGCLAYMEDDEEYFFIKKNMHSLTVSDLIVTENKIDTAGLEKLVEEGWVVD